VFSSALCFPNLFFFFPHFFFFSSQIRHLVPHRLNLPTESINPTNIIIIPSVYAMKHVLTYFPASATFFIFPSVNLYFYQIVYQSCFIYPLSYMLVLLTLFSPSFLVLILFCVPFWAQEVPISQHSSN
jgi:hypothetical protein